MSILIKSMKMPVGADELRLIIRSNGQVIISKKTYYEETEAVELPPHGDLIERDKVNLTDFEIVMCEGNYKEGMKMLLEKIRTAPTIIEAEESE